jgi:fatty acid desaturase
MMETTTATLTGEEVAIAKTAIRVIRVVTAVGVAIAIPVGLVFALPLLSYALLAGIIVAPVLVGVVLYRSGHQDAPLAG